MNATTPESSKVNYARGGFIVGVLALIVAFGGLVVEYLAWQYPKPPIRKPAVPATEAVVPAKKSPVKPRVTQASSSSRRQRSQSTPTYDRIQYAAYLDSVIPPAKGGLPIAQPDNLPPPAQGGLPIGAVGR